MKKSSIGGQGVLDGVMMRSPKTSALAVRKESGEIVTKKWENKVREKGFLTWPVVRGVVNFVEMMVNGMSVIMDAAKMAENGEEEYEPNKFEKYVAKKTGKSAMDVMMGFAVVLAIVLAVGLFFILPTVITNWIKGGVQSSILINLIDGGVRLAIFLTYMILVSRMKDIKTVFRYHGAEHKTVSCYEHDEELTVENVRKYKTLHPRCGTSYLLLVMIVTILVYSLLGWNENIWLRFGTRILLLPVIAGLAYELLKFAAKGDSLFFRIIRWPGMQLQRLTTAQPTDEQMEVAILAFEMALGEKSEQEIEEMRERFDHSAKKAAEESELPEETAEEFPAATAAK
ncbi:DUF1385 domain-containing protein [Christensenellaceae bacterium NSJ-63]|uniref:DUF1385 domain-containing protein n=1 Tax=Guopingia tenuis TaxID=2763656 RepID=A0A926HWF2_9FIRM|nr:DUF1385 domain-containing protein [Guopingia tenuis]MBC8538293.1 DUF1385 domain-containing protein [Guopingia tenuis]